MEYVICHYNEIGLKGKNRIFFEKKLIENIGKSLNKAHFSWIKRYPGRIIIKLTKRGKENPKDIKNSLNHVFGLAHYSFSIISKSEIKDLKTNSLKLISKEKGKTFKIETTRSDKKFPLTSQEVNKVIGESILKKAKKQVKLKKPSITCFIEILQNNSFLYLKKIKGIGGLPVTTAGKVISLISSGIDSPAASYFLMKRGAKNIFIHFHSYPQTDKESITKTEDLVKILTKYQFSSKLYLIPFSEIQKQILLKTPDKFRIILYRRMMLRITEEIAKKEKAQAIVTGESLGQVASQTLENIRAIAQPISLPIFRPLIGKDKEEIINIAKDIGTYNISILPHQDCCSRFLPKQPETKANIKEIQEKEKNINIKELIKNSLENLTIKGFKS